MRSLIARHGRRSLFASALAVLLTVGCAAGMVTSSLYQGPQSGPAASVRFNVASSSSGFFNGMGIYIFGDERCSESEFGRFVGEIGKDKMLLSTNGNSIGMPKTAGYNDFAYVERRFRADRPVVFSIRAHTGGPTALCSQSYVFTPTAGEMFEIRLVIDSGHRCGAQVLAVAAGTGELSQLPPGSLRRLPNYCTSKSLLN